MFVERRLNSEKVKGVVVHLRSRVRHLIMVVEKLEARHRVSGVFILVDQGDLGIAGAHVLDLVERV